MKRRPGVAACALLGASALFVPVVLAKYGEYEGSDVIVYGGSVLALIGGCLGAAVGYLLNRR